MESETRQAIGILIEKVKQETFIDPLAATNEDALGILVANFCDWDGEAIREVALAAFEDANFHGAEINL